MPQALQIESAASSDFDDLYNAVWTNGASFVIRGFEIDMTNALGSPAPSLEMVTANSAFLHTPPLADSISQPGSSVSGTQYICPVDDGPQILDPIANAIVQGAFTPSATNYIGLELVRAVDDATADTVYFWDPTSNSEFSKNVPLARILSYNIYITTTSWASNVMPICVIATDANNNVLSVTDARYNLFRLGTGGATPDPNFVYPWTAQTTPTFRTENPSTAAGSVTYNPFEGGDKMLYCFKDWANAVMSIFKEIKGTPYWYSLSGGPGPGPSPSLAELWFDAVGSIITSAGGYSHTSSGTNSTLTWSDTLYLQSIVGNLEYQVPAGSVTLADQQVAYLALVRDNDFQPTNIFSFVAGNATITTSISAIGLIFPGDWIKLSSDPITAYTKVLSVGAGSITLTTGYQGTTGTGSALSCTGSYTVQVADPESVPNSANTYWLCKRADNTTPFSVAIAASPTGAVRSGGVITFTTTAPHGLVLAQYVRVNAVTDSTFNGVFQVTSTPTPTTFTVDEGGVDATSGSGTVTNRHLLYIRYLGVLNDGEITQVDGSFPAEVLVYIGSPSEIATAPDYGNVTDPSNFPYNLPNAITGLTSLTEAISQDVGNMTAMSKYMAMLYENNNVRLVDGGEITFTAGVGLTFTEPFILNFNSHAVGGAPVNVTLGTSPWALTANGNMIYALINRSTDGTPALASLVQDTSTLPATIPLNYDLWLIAVRNDSADGTPRVYFQDGTALNDGETSRLGEGGGGGSGDGINDDLISMLFQGKITDTFAVNNLSPLTTINPTLTNAVYQAGIKSYTLSFDGSKTVSGNTTTYTLSAPAVYTVGSPAINDILIIGNVARTITGIAGAVLTVDATFGVIAPGTPCCVSQCVESKELYHLAADGDSLSVTFSDQSFTECLIDYEDAPSGNVFDIAAPALVAYSASGATYPALPNPANWSNVQTRPQYQYNFAQTTGLAGISDALYVRFFANKIGSAANTVNLLRYRAYMLPATPSTYQNENAAYGMTDGSDTPVNLSFSVSAGKTLVSLSFQYPVGVNPGSPHGSIDVYLNGQLIPRYIAGTTNLAYYTEVSSSSILLDQNYSAFNLDVEVIQRVTIIDTNTQNTNDIATLNSEVATLNSEVATNTTNIATNTSNIATINSQINKVPQYTIYTSGSGTYTPPAGTLWLKVKMVGGGGGGYRGDSNNAPGDGGTTTFGAASAGGGQRGTGIDGSIASGGAANLGGYAGLGISGADANTRDVIAGNLGSGGASSALGGAGACGFPIGTAAKANSGSGGGGGNNGGTLGGGSGGAAGAYCEFYPPVAPHAYSVGIAGTAPAGSSAAGGAGVIFIEAHFQ